MKSEPGLKNETTRSHPLSPLRSYSPRPMGMAPVNFQSPGMAFVAECWTSANEGMWHDMGGLQFFATGMTFLFWVGIWELWGGWWEKTRSFPPDTYIESWIEGTQGPINSKNTLFLQGKIETTFGCDQGLCWYRGAWCLRISTGPTYLFLRYTSLFWVIFSAGILRSRKEVPSLGLY